MNQEKYLRHFITGNHQILRATRNYTMNHLARFVYSRGAPLRSPWGWVGLAWGWVELASLVRRVGCTSMLLTLLCLTTTLFLHPLHASARSKQSPVISPTLQVTVGFEDDARVNYWIPVQVTLDNQGSHFSGVLAVTTYAGFSRQVVTATTLPWSYQAPVDLPHGSLKQINMNVPFYESPAVPQGIVAILRDTKGKIITTQTATPYILHSSSLLIGILSDYPAQSPQFSSLSKVSLPDPERSVELATLNPGTMPNTGEVLENFDVIILDDFTTNTLNRDQLNALQTWINRGGALIAIGGSDWQRTLGTLPPQLLPVILHGTAILPAGTHLLPVGSPTITGADPKAISDTLHQSISISNATLPGDSDIGQETFSDIETVLGTTSDPLMVQAHQGQGTICYLAFDPADTHLMNWIGATALWQGLLLRTLGDQSLLSASVATYSSGPGQSVLRGGFLQMLQPGTPFPAWYLVILLLGYIIILGPIRYFFVLTQSKGDRRKRASWNWRIIISSIMVFSLLTYGLVFIQKRPTINSISVIQINQGDTTAHVTNFFSSFFPDNGNAQLQLPVRSLAQPITNSFLQDDPTISSIGGNITFSIGQNETNINLQNASPWTFHRFVSESDQKLQGGLSSHLALRNAMLTGTITNNLGTDLNDVFILMNHGFAFIGDLPAQQTRHVNISFHSSNLSSGSTLADQIAIANHLPVPYFPFAHGSQPKNDFQLHLAMLSALSGEGMYFPPCGGPCSTYAIAGKHSIAAPLFGMPKLNPIDGNDPLLINAAQATLIGWSRNRVDTINGVRVNGTVSGGTFEDLIQVPLNIVLDPSSTLQPGIINGQVINAQGNEVQIVIPGIYGINLGSVTFEFFHPDAITAQTSNLTINLPYVTQQAVTNLLPARLYNWYTQSWDSITINKNSFTTANSKAYTSSDGRVLLQIMNQQNLSQSTLYVGRPTLILSNVGN